MNRTLQHLTGVTILVILFLLCGQREQKATFQEQIRNGNVQGEILEEQDCTYLKESYNGKLSNKQQKDIMEKWLTYFSGDLVAEWEIEGMKNYYITARKMQKGIVIGGAVINLNIVFSYQEQVQQTICYVATPVLNLDY